MPMASEQTLTATERRQRLRQEYSAKIRAHVASQDVQDFLDLAVQSWPKTSETFRVFGECAAMSPQEDDRVAKHHHLFLLDLAVTEMRCLGMNIPALTDLLLMLYNYLDTSGYDYRGGTWSDRE